MGKSLGNTVDLDELFEKYGPTFVRLYIVKNHYRSVLDFSDEQLEETRKTYDKFMNLVEQTEEYKNLDISNTKYEDIDEMKKRFLEAMDDDLNTAVAIAVLLEFVKEANKAKDVDNVKMAYIRKVFDDLAGNMLGLKFEVQAKTSDDNLERLVKSIVEVRSTFKANKQYEYSDLIRDKLKENGISIIDTKDGAKVEF